MTPSDANPADSGAGHGSATRLIVNADDFGISERVNDGIVMAHRGGIVTAASMMAVGRAFEHAVEWCRRIPSLDVGVHLTLVAEKPLLHGGSSLTGDDGRFPRSIGVFLRRYLTGRLRLADIQAELSAQIERVLEHGLRVTHLDSHQHVHAVPGIAELTLQLSARYGIPFVRVPVEELHIDRPLGFHAMFRLAGAMALRTCGAIVRISGSGAESPPRLHFLGFTEGGRLNRARLHRILRALRPQRAYELMCHPGFPPDEPEVKRWRYRHEQELQALTSGQIRSEAVFRGIRLCSFKDLI
jgi:predicted glycoside hydrolase/deacetylase ChbG (UPF0249 family)